MEVLLSSGKEQATKVVSKVPVGVDDPLPNEEGINPNDRFCFADACPNVKFEEVVTFDKKGGFLRGRGAFKSSCPGH